MRGSAQRQSRKGCRPATPRRTRPPQKLCAFQPDSLAPRRGCGVAVTAGVLERGECVRACPRWCVREEREGEGECPSRRPRLPPCVCCVAPAGGPTDDDDDDHRASIHLSPSLGLASRADPPSAYTASPLCQGTPSVPPQVRLRLSPIQSPPAPPLLLLLPGLLHRRAAEEPEPCCLPRGDRRRPPRPCVREWRCNPASPPHTQCPRAGMPCTLPATTAS